MDTSFHASLRTFLAFLTFEKRYSKHTIVAYEQDLADFFSFAVREFAVAGAGEITPVMVRTWLAGLRSEQLAARTLNRKASSLKSFFKYQLRTGGLPASPMVGISTPKSGRRLPEYVAEAAMEDLFTHAGFPDSWRGRTDRLLLQLFYQTGMRLSELVSLQEAQVDYGRQAIKVLGKGNKERVIPAGTALLGEMRRYADEKRAVAGADCHVFFIRENGKPLYHKYVYLAVKHYLGLITTLNRKSPHILRHTFATHLTSNGAALNAVKELLGHSSLASTQVYTHNNIERLKAAHKKAHPGE